MAHDFNESLLRGKKGEAFYVWWVRENYPGAKATPAPPTLDRHGVDLLVVEEKSVQVKRETRVQDTGNLFIETESKKGVPG